MKSEVRYGRPREFDEAEVIRSAMHVFWNRGFEGSSVQDLVEATGLQRGSLYGAFGDKHALFMAALDDYCELRLHQVRELLEDAVDPAEALRTFVRNGASDCGDPRKRLRGCLVGNTCSELVAHDDAARRRIEAFVADMQSVMVMGLRRAQAAGTFGSERDAEATAAFVQCSLQGLALLAKSRPSHEVIRGVVDEILRVLD